MRLSTDRSAACLREQTENSYQSMLMLLLLLLLLLLLSAKPCETAS